MSWYLALALATAGTYAVRLASVHAFGSGALSGRVERALQLTALAILAALAVSSVPIAEGGSVPSVADASALVAAIVAARRIHNIALIVAIAIAAHTVVGAVVR